MGEESVSEQQVEPWRGSESERRQGHQCVGWGQNKDGGTREKPEQGGVT